MRRCPVVTLVETKWSTLTTLLRECVEEAKGVDEFVVFEWLLAMRSSYCDIERMTLTLMPFGAPCE